MMGLYLRHLYFSTDILKGADSVMTLWQMHTIIKCINSDKDIIYRVDIDLM